jgi:hypothetical protein
MDVCLTVVYIAGVYLMGVDLTGVLRLIEVGATTIKGGCDNYPRGVRRLSPGGATYNRTPPKRGY